MPQPLRTVIIRHEYKPKDGPQVQGKGEENLFVIRHEAGLGALKYWLRARKFNTFIETTDAKGNPLLGLLWDYEFGKHPSTRRKERGVIVVWDKKLLKATALIILKYVATENEYGKLWRDQQINNWQYGRT